MRCTNRNSKCAKWNEIWETKFKMCEVKYEMCEMRSEKWKVIFAKSKIRSSE